MQYLHELIAHGQVRTVFQPIVDLDHGSVVAYEALSRGPEGELERPDLLFDAARRHGCLAELDSLCRTTALRSAVTAGIASPVGLFVNVEPEVLDLEALDGLIDIARDAPGGLQVVLEITERAIAARPADLLAAVRRLRAAGWRIALDDVGADDMSLAFMPLLRPDVVKLDLKLVQERPGPAVAAIMNAVNAYSQRTGAVLLAEGIEDERHLQIARALGATLGQGWLFGRPLPGTHPRLPAAALHLAPAQESPSTTSPFQCLPESTVLRTSTKPLLVELSKHLEGEALGHGSTCVVVSTFQFAHHFTPATADRYRQLAARVGFVAAVGEGLASEPVPGVRGANLSPNDPLRDEWDLVVLAPHFAAALLARDLGDTGPDRDRRFQFALTYDRQTVAAAAESLLSRVRPTSTSHTARLPAAMRSAGSTRSARPARPARPTGPTEPVPDTGVSPVPTVSLVRDADGNTSTVLRRALAATTNGVTIVDVTRPDQPLVYVNAAFERLSGLTAEEMLGRNCRLLQGEGTDAAAVARIRAAIAQGQECQETILNYRQDMHQPWWNEILLSPIFDESGNAVQYIGVQNDVTARVNAETELEQERQRSATYQRELETLAYRDPLTGVLNRRRLFHQLEAQLQHARAANTAVGVLYIDLDDFKLINDTSGHSHGDTVLGSVAQLLRIGRRADDLVARIGGDEFVVVLPDLDPLSAELHLARAAADLRRRLAGDAAMVSVSVSVGASSFPADGDHVDALLHAADRRMYLDKSRTRSA